MTIPATGSRPGGILVAAALVVTLALPRTSTAQAMLQSPDAGWSEDLTYAAANAAISGIVAGVIRGLTDEGSFGEAFWPAAAGGTLTYVGKRLASQRFGGAGLVGRQVASLGGSVVANARDGRGAFQRLTLQLGLGRLYWDRIESEVRFRPDLVTIAYTAFAVASDGVEVDWSRTLQAGAPTFSTRRGATMLDAGAAGRTFGGVVVVDANASLPASLIAAHEQVHVVQYDQQFALWAEAAEQGLASLLGPGVERALGRVDLGVGFLPFAPLLGRVPRHTNPFEAEAEALTTLGGH